MTAIVDFLLALYNSPNFPKDVFGHESVNFHVARSNVYLALAERSISLKISLLLTVHAKSVKP